MNLTVVCHQSTSFNANFEWKSWIGKHSNSSKHVSVYRRSSLTGTSFKKTYVFSGPFLEILIAFLSFRWTCSLMVMLKYEETSPRIGVGVLGITDLGWWFSLRTYFLVSVRAQQILLKIASWRNILILTQKIGIVEGYINNKKKRFIVESTLAAHMIKNRDILQGFY